MVIPRILAAKIEAYGAQKIIKLIEGWERKRDKDKKRYSQVKGQLSNKAQ